MSEPEAAAGPTAHGPAGRAPDREPERDERTGRAAAAERIRHQARWVDLQVQRAIERGEFDDLPGRGKPLAGLDRDHDPDWWLKQLVEREKISVLPPALALRREDAQLEAQLDRVAGERDVRVSLEDFNARVRRARMQLEGGPPVITPERDVEAEVAAWRARRAARVARQSEAVAQEPRPPRGRWRRRRSPR